MNGRALEVCDEIIASYEHMLEIVNGMENGDEFTHWRTKYQK